MEAKCIQILIFFILTNLALSNTGDATPANTTEAPVETTAAAVTTAKLTESQTATVATTVFSNTTLVTITTTAFNENATTVAVNVTQAVTTAATTDNSTNIAPNTTTPVNVTTAATTAIPVTTAAPNTTPAATTPVPTTLALTTVAVTTPNPTTQPPTTAKQTTVEVTEPPETTAAPTTRAPVTTPSPTTGASPGTTKPVVTTQAVSTAPAEVICTNTTETVLLSEVRSDVTCEGDSNSAITADDDDTVEITFSTTQPGQYAKTNQTCKACENANVAVGVRFCNAEGVWEEPMYLKCSLNIADIQDVSKQAEALFVSTSELSNTDSSKAKTTLSIVGDLSESETMNEAGALVALNVLGNLLGSTGETYQAVVELKEVVRSAIKNFAEKLEQDMTKGYSAFSLAAQFLTHVSSKRRKRHSFCTSSTVGTDTEIQQNSQLSEVELKPPAPNTEYDYYASAENCGEEGGYIFVLYASAELFDTSSDNSVNGPIFFIGSTNTFVGTTQVKIQLYEKFDDTVDTKENGTHIETTSVNSTCAMWIDSISKWSEIKCTTEITTNGVKCSCTDSGNIAVLKKTQVTYEVIEAPNNGLTTGQIVGIAVGACAGVILLIAIIICIYKVKKKNERKILPQGDQNYEMGNSRRSTPNGFGTH